MEYQKLYRSRNNRVVAGVAGGLGEFFLIDPVILRIIFVILALMGGGGVLIYVLIWIFVPFNIESNFASSYPGANPNTNQEPKESEIKDKEIYTEQKHDDSPHHHYKGTFFSGIILITIGILFIIREIIPGLSFNKLWPILLIVIGLLLLGGAFKRTSNN